LVLRLFYNFYSGFSYRLLSFPIEKLVNLLLRLFIGPLSREIWIIFLQLGIVLYHALYLVIPRVFDLDFGNGFIMKTSSLFFEVLQNCSSRVAALIWILGTRLLFQIENVNQGVI